MAVGDEEIFKIFDEVDPESDGCKCTCKDGKKCFSVAETDEESYKTSYNRACHGKRCQDKKYQAYSTVAFDERPVFVGALSGALHKPLKRLIGYDIQFMPGAYEERVEDEYHDRFDEKIEGDEYECIYLGGDANGESCHPPENDICSGNAKQRLEIVGKKECAEQKKQEKRAKQCKPEEEDAPFAMAEK